MKILYTLYYPETKGTRKREQWIFFSPDEATVRVTADAVELTFELKAITYGQHLYVETSPIGR